MKKALALLLAVMMIVSMAACGETKTQDGNKTVTYVDPYKGMDYEAKSSAIYEAVLGEFAKAYEAAKAAETVSERYALMAIAEAKLMEAAVMIPLSSQGGNYAISAVAPYTVANALWGNDSYRYHSVVVANEPIKAAEREEMKAKYNELKGTGTYEAWAKEYLTGKGYTIQDTYTLGYSSDPQTWDVLYTARSADSEAIINTYDGLYEYDNEGVLQPALALSHTVTDNEDGTQTYTFTLRQGVKWVDSQGRQVDTVTADDFVAGMQHMLDTGSQLGYLAYEAAQIVGSYDYYAGNSTDFATVGVKAIDDYTVEYTLAAPCTFFTTMLGYNVFAPMSRSYYESQGGKFGEEFDSSAESYTYGKDKDSIAYCGPYLVTNATAENTIVFKANKSYWNAANINIQTITWMYNDGEDALKGYNDMVAGILDGTGLNSSALEKARLDKKDELIYVSSCDATSFMGFYNLNREAFANVNDETSAASSKTDAEKTRTYAAMQNVHFRRALSMSLDRGAYNAQTVGEELKLTSLRNCYTPGNFVYLEEDVTVSINGTDKTYAAGTYYGQIMQDQIDADNVAITVWDPEAEAGAGSSDGFDGWYNPEAAAEEMAKAVAELKAQGIEITDKSPIELDLPCFAGSEAYLNRANAYKQSLETALNGQVKVNLIECTDSSAWYYAGYYCGAGSEMNFDIYDVSGWGPDYGDPQTYLDTFLPDYSGYMCMMLGIF